MRYVALLLSALLFAAPAMAEQERTDDTITVQLTTESYVTASTALVTLNVNAALKDADAAGTRKEILAGAQKVSKTNWRMVNFNSSQDQTGLTRWHATLEARLPEAQLTSLPDAAKNASRAGLQFTVGGTNLSPTLDEMEAGRAKLRAKLLDKANAELAAVNQKSGGRIYRIGDISFGEQGMPMPVPPMKMMRGAAMEMAVMDTAASSGGEGLSVDQKITMSAWITFATAAK